jgi:hypothetical protein
MLRKIKWQIPGEHLTARYNWCQVPIPGRLPAVEKHCFTKQFCKARSFVDRNTFNKFCILKFTITAQMYEYLMQFISSAIPWKLSLGFHGSPYVLFSETHIRASDCPLFKIRSNKIYAVHCSRHSITLTSRGNIPGSTMGIFLVGGVSLWWPWSG